MLKSVVNLIIYYYVNISVSLTSSSFLTPTLFLTLNVDVCFSFFFFSFHFPEKFENSGTSDGFSFETVSPNNDHPKYLDGGHGLGVTLQASWSVSLLTIFTTYCIGAIHLWSWSGTERSAAAVDTKWPHTIERLLVDHHSTINNTSADHYYDFSYYYDYYYYNQLLQLLLLQTKAKDFFFMIFFSPTPSSPRTDRDREGQCWMNELKTWTDFKRRMKSNMSIFISLKCKPHFVAHGRDWMKFLGN